MSSVLWYQTKDGHWHYYKAGNATGQIMIRTIEDVVTWPKVNEYSPMFCWLSDGWWRVNLFNRKHASDIRCEQNEVPEEVLMKHLLVGD